MPGHVRERACEDTLEAVPEEILDHPDVQVQIERLRAIRTVEPDPRLIHIDRAVDTEQIQGMIQDHGIEGRLDAMADADVFAGLDIDDRENPFLKPDQVRAAGREPVYRRIKPVSAPEMDGDRDGRLVDGLSRGEAGEEVEALLDGE